jgi:parvulin-like peptidyl-prolyl isomerase
LLCAFALLAPLTARAADPVVERVAAVVDSEIILLGEVDQMASAFLRGADESTTGQRALADARKKALDQLIDSQLIRQQAAELKLSVTSEEIDRAIEEVKKQNNLDDDTFDEALKQQGFTRAAYRKNLRKQILELKVMNTAVRSRIQITDDEVKAYYQKSARQLAGDRTAHLRQVLISVPEGLSPDEAEQKSRVARKVVELAREGKSFGELAKKFSDDALTKESGGDLGWVGKGVLVDEIEQAVETMDAGDVRGPIRTARGYMIVQLVERKEGDVRPLEEVKDTLRRQLYEQQLEKATQAWLRELRKKAHVDVRL